MDDKIPAFLIVERREGGVIKQLNDLNGRLAQTQHVRNTLEEVFDNVL